MLGTVLSFTRSQTRCSTGHACSRVLDGHTACWGSGDRDDPWADLVQHGIRRQVPIRGVEPDSACESTHLHLDWPKAPHGVS